MAQDYIDQGPPAVTGLWRNLTSALTKVTDLIAEIAAASNELARFVLQNAKNEQFADFGKAKIPVLPQLSSVPSRGWGAQS
jgi:hypothetical protein